MTHRLKGRDESFKITFSLNRPEMSQRRKFHFLLQILAAQAKIWHGEADVAFFEQSGGKNGNSYVRNLFDDDLFWFLLFLKPKIIVVILSMSRSKHANTSHLQVMCKSLRSMCKSNASHIQVMCLIKLTCK